MLIQSHILDTHVSYLVLQKEKNCSWKYDPISVLLCTHTCLCIYLYNIYNCECTNNVDRLEEIYYCSYENNPKDWKQSFVCYLQREGQHHDLYISAQQ